MRILVSSAVGALIVFFWGAISWAALDLWGDAAGTLAGEAESSMGEALDAALDETGVYFTPAMPEHAADASPEVQQQAMDAWTVRHQEGPIAMVVFQQDGFEPMAPSIMAMGVAMNFVAALLVAVVMVAVGGGYGRRFAAGLGMAVFAAITGHGMYWNWFRFPDDWSSAMAADQIIGWTLATLLMAAIVRSRPPVGA
ncbi:MAG: hypothetical protein ACO38W_02225 [Phycisphaerales bacterium]